MEIMKYFQVSAKILYAGMLFFMLPCTPCLAQEQAKDQPVVLGEIVVMASQPGVEINANKTIIKLDEFQKPGNFNTLTDILTEIGGVDVMRVNPFMASPGDEVSIRGLNEGRLVIEIDGRRINQTGHYGRYIVDWSTIDIKDVSSIEIIRGGHSALHPFAIGGVINIITKKGRTLGQKPKFSARAGYGKDNTWNTSASIDASAGKIASYHISASNRETDGYLRNNFQESQNFNGHITFYLPKGATWDLGCKYSDVLYGMPVIKKTGFEFIHNTRKRGKALLHSLLQLLVE